MNELIKIQSSNINGQEVNAVDARDLHTFLDLKEHFTEWIDRYVSEKNEYGFVVNSDFCRSTCIAENGRKMETYLVLLDMAKELSMISKTEKGKEARKYFIECEKIALKPRELTTLEIFQRALESETARLKAIEERDKAIEERTWIGSKREATAMNKASQLSKVNQKLLDEIGDGKQFKTAKAIPWIKEFFNITDTAWQQIGKQLTAISKEFGFTTKKAESSEFGTVKTYDVQVINILKNRLTENHNLLGNYRKTNGVIPRCLETA